MLWVFQDHIAAPHTENLVARVGDFAVHSSSVEKVPFLVWLLAGGLISAFPWNSPAEAEDNEHN